AASENVAAATDQSAAARAATMRAVSAESAARHSLQTVETSIETTGLALTRATERCTSDRASLREFSTAVPNLDLETPLILQELFDERKRLVDERDRALSAARDAAAERTARETACLLAEQSIADETVSLANATRALE